MNELSMAMFWVVMQQITRVWGDAMLVTHRLRGSTSTVGSPDSQTAWICDVILQPPSNPPFSGPDLNVNWGQLRPTASYFDAELVVSRTVGYPNSWMVYRDLIVQWMA
jgi:hypothetical protein